VEVMIYVRWKEIAWECWSVGECVGRRLVSSEYD